MIQVVTIKNKVTLYKGEEPANSIELLQFEEFGFEVVSAKGRFSVGDKAFLIEPDYNLPDSSHKFSSLFADWVSPGGDPKKSKLGKNNRIRAVKFNLHRGDNQPVYSNGIILSVSDLDGYVHVDFDDPGDIGGLLGIYKHQEAEYVPKQGQGRKPAKGFPKGLYRTDEPNIDKERWAFPIQLIGSEKIDGSSITLYYKDGNYGICSRNIDLPLTEEKVVGKKSGMWNIIKSWLGFDINVYETVANDSPFITVGLPYLQRLVGHCVASGKNIALRGELVGAGASAGSGNKNNPHLKVEPTIYFYGADHFDVVAKKMEHQEYIELVVGLGFQHPTIVFNQLFDSVDDLKKACNSYFSRNLIEGIVVRNLDSTLSAKVMSYEYDSKK